MKFELTAEQLLRVVSAGPGAELKRLMAYFELAKPRVTFLVVMTTAASFYLASQGSLNLVLLLHTLVGTTMLAAGTAALNQFIEREADAKMQRTWGRPLPSGRLSAGSARTLGLILVWGGVLYLGLAANVLAALLGLVTSIVYLGMYTPLKKRTTLCTAVGAFTGAVPPLIGWAAARGELDFRAWALFAILFVWQFPHFLSISWIYREDYERGGFRMLPVIDRDGRKTAQQIVAYSLALLPLSLVPWLSELAGSLYLGGALSLGLAFLWISRGTTGSPSTRSARRVFRASVLYLPLLLALMVADKV